jgi:integrase
MYARKLVVEINNKLHSGWNPFLEQEAPKAYTKLIDALNIFLKNKMKEFTSKDSIRTYKSHVEIMQHYINNVIKEPDILVLSFDSRYVNNYMNYLYNDRNLGNRSFNNSKRFAIAAWNWFIENLYCKTNPFLIVKNKLVTGKTRQIIDVDTRTRIKDYCLDNNKNEFLAIIMLCFHGLLRPKEICELKPDNFRIKDRIIVLTPEMTKDKDKRIVSISNDLMNYLKCLDIENIDKDSYIYSMDSFKPGRRQNNTRYVGKEWDKIRKELKFSDTYQFYSLKDSGIVQMLLDGIPPIEVKNQAGHSSLQQTEEYAVYANPTGSEKIKNKGVKF